MNLSLTHTATWPPKLIPSTAIIFLLSLATIAALLFPPQTMSSVEQFRVNSLGALPEIGPGTVLTQTFKAPNDFDGFGLLFASYEYILDQGILKIEIYRQEEPAGTCSVEARNLVDLSFFHCDVAIVGGEQYKLLISTEDMTSPITFLTTTAQIDGATLTIDSKKQEQVIVMDFTVQRNNYMLAWAFAMSVSLVACYFAANMNKESHDSKRD